MPEDLRAIANMKPWEVRPALLAYVEKLERESKDISDPQFRSIWLYCEHVADALRSEGHSLQDVLAKTKKVEIIPTKESIREVVWKPIQQAMFKTSSTKQLKSHQITMIWEVANRFFSTEFGLHVPFPSRETYEDKNHSEDLGQGPAREARQDYS